MDYLNFKKNFELELFNFWQEQKDASNKINFISEQIVDKIAEISLSKGKRIRPWLAIVGFGLFGQKMTNSLFKKLFLPLGLSLEIFHTFCLIHDDIIDKSNFRRQIPTIHNTFQKIFLQQKIVDSYHYGISAGILAGDLTLILSQQFLDNLELSYDTKKLYREMQLEVCYGQNDDTLGIGLADIEKLQKEDILKMLDYKSGRYSVEKPLLIGASLSNQNTEKFNFISKIGKNIGLVFQLTDDILGVFGDEEKTGKSTSSDLFEGKRTLLMYDMYHLANEKEKKLISVFLKKDNKTQEEVENIKEIMIKYKVKEKTLGFCEELIDKNNYLLKKYFDVNNYYVGWLIDFQQKILFRQS